MFSKPIYLIYKHTSPSGKSYIGLTSDYDYRCYRHQQKSSGCTAFYNAIKKYGWDNFTHEFLYIDLTLDQATELETKLITEHNTKTPNGYNIRLGGGMSTIVSFNNRGRKHTDEARANMSNSKIGKVGHKQKPESIAGRCKSYIVTDPTGKCTTIFNLNKWCRDNELNSVCMGKVAMGKLKQYKGWLCKFVEPPLYIT